MIKRVPLQLLCCGMLLLLGCETIHNANPFEAHLANRAEIEKHLPNEVKMSMIACWGPAWKNRETVEQQLVKIYAHVGKDGKICDAAGEEIHFATMVSHTSTPREYQLSDKDKEELDRLKPRYSALIVVITESKGTF